MAIGTSIVGIIFQNTLVAELVSPISVLLVLVVPGLLVLLGLSRSGEVDSRVLVYSVGLSATVLMFLGFFVNLTHQIAGFASLRALPLWVCFGALLLVLAAWANRRVHTDEISIDLGWSSRVPLLGFVLVAAVVGTVYMERGGTNAFVLATLGLLFLIYAVSAFDPSHREGLLYVIALSLLYSNALASRFLLWGDQAKEAHLAFLVLQAGYWSPTGLPYANKAGMLRIVILHPLHFLLTGLDLTLILKIVHPLMFAIAPVALYQTFASRDQAGAGYIAAGAFMFSFPFITVLSKNTRTAAAILFIILFVRVLLDREIDAFVRRVLLAAFGVSVFVSHYGAGYMFFAMLTGGFVLATVGRRVLHQDSLRHDRLPAGTVTLVALVSIAWYGYVSPRGASLGTVAGFVVTFLDKLQSGFFQPSSSATANYVTTSFTSLSLNGVKVLTVVIFGIIGLGWLVALIRARRVEIGVESRASYLAISSIAGALFATTILPVEKFNTARTMMVSLAVVAPLLLIGVHGLLDIVDRRRVSPRWLPVAICLLVLAPYFVFSSGLLAATVTHDYSPNVLTYREDVIEDGSPQAKIYLFKQYLPETGAKGGQWLKEYATGDIYGSEWPGNPNSGPLREREKAKEHPNTYYGDISAVRGGDCIYLSPFTVYTGLLTVPSSHFDRAYILSSELSTTRRSQVYANGGAEMYCLN